MRGTNSCGTPVITAALVTLAKTIGQSGMSAARRRYRVYGTPKRSKRKKMTPQPNASIPKRVFPVARIATGPRGSPATQPGTRYEHPRGKAEADTDGAAWPALKLQPLPAQFPAAPARQSSQF